jgi:hypothetical protein
LSYKVGGEELKTVLFDDDVVVGSYGHVDEDMILSFRKRIVFDEKPISMMMIWLRIVHGIMTLKKI